MKRPQQCLEHSSGSLLTGGKVIQRPMIDLMVQLCVIQLKSVLTPTTVDKANFDKE